MRRRNSSKTRPKTSQTTTSGGTDRPNVVDAGEVNVPSEAGALPVTLAFVQTRIPPATIDPTASVTISGGTRQTFDTRPLKAPTAAPKPTTARSTSGNARCDEPLSWAVITLPAPTRAGIDRSIPPSRTTSVWPAAAKPRKAARISIERMALASENPAIVDEPTAKTMSTASSCSAAVSRTSRRAACPSRPITWPPPARGGRPCGGARSST